MGAPMVKLRKISGLVFAGLLMTSAAVPVASASAVSDIFAQYPDGGTDFTNALLGEFPGDVMGFAQMAADQWEGATAAQKNSLQYAASFCGANADETARIRAVLPFSPTASCHYDPPPTPFRRTSTGTNNGSGFGGGSISPNTQQNNNNNPPS